MRISPFTSRLLALILLVGCIFLLFELVAAPLYAEYKDNRAAIDEAYRLEARYRAIAASRPALVQRLHDMEAGLNVSELSFPGTSDALTGAKIQSTLKDLVGAAGGRLNSTQILAAVEESGFRRVAVRVQMVSDIAAFQAILHELENITPYHFIDNVTVRENAASRRRRARRSSRASRSSRSSRSKAAWLPQGNGQLNIRFDVLGYAKPGDS